MNSNTSPVIGIPRAMLYYRYGTQWEKFFETLGVTYVISPPGNREILQTGASIAVDETCLSAKMFMGHVQYLLDKCDLIFIPRYSSFSHNEVFCTRFEGLYDQMRNVFRTDAHRFITCNIDEKQGHSEKQAFEELGRSLGCSAADSRKAYVQAVKAEKRRRKMLSHQTEELSRKKGIRILLAGHPYSVSDPYLGKPILDYLQKSGVTVLRADAADPEAARRACAKFSPTCRWAMSKELVGGTMLWKDRADGIILISAFPCGPDSMTNELLTHRIKDVPVLNLVLDTQTGTAGIETRLESFLDIIHLKKEGELP